MNGRQTPTRVFVTVGTDHHPFDRLVDWSDRLATSHPTWSLFVQYGTSRPPVHASGSSHLTWHEMDEHLAEADVVVTHGGPGCINDARRWSHVPICVPRDPAFGEHVDDHQLRFCAFMNDRGLVAVAAGKRGLELAIEESAGSRPTGSARREHLPTPVGVDRFSAVMNELAQRQVSAGRRRGPRLTGRR